MLARYSWDRSAEKLLQIAYGVTTLFQTLPPRSKPPALSTGKLRAVSVLSHPKFPVKAPVLQCPERWAASSTSLPSNRPRCGLPAKCGHRRGRCSPSARTRRAGSFSAAGGHAAVAAQGAGRQLGVAPHTGRGLVALPLQGAGSNDPGAHIGAGLAALLRREIVIFNRKCLHMQVNAVQQRPRKCAAGRRPRRWACRYTPVSGGRDTRICRDSWRPPA